MNPKQDSETLMNAILPLAERMLIEYGEFYPFGGYMKADGAIVHVGAADSDTDRPKSKDMIYVLWSSFQEMARTSQCKAAAIVLDVAVTLPNSNRESDAIQVCVEHADGYSAEIFFPYEIVDKRLVYDQTFAQPGKREIFEQKDTI
jgi:hypothetical protein